MVRLGEVIHAVQASARTRSVRLEARSSKQRWRYWQAGDRIRLETEPGGHLEITGDDLSWRLVPGDGLTEYRATTLSYWPVQTLVDLTGLLSAQLTLLGEADVAGRHAARIMARRRPGFSDHLMLAWGLHGDGSEIWVDVERGVGLRTAQVEVTTIAFDETFDTSLFARPSVSAQTEVRVAPTQVRALTLEEAVASSPFRLMAPRRLPEGSRFITWQAWGEKPVKWVGGIYVVEPGPRFTLQVNLKQGRPENSPGEVWESTEVAGVKVEIHEGGPNLVLPSMARIERDGVTATVTSDLPIDMTAEIASTMQPL
jgi:hypothetical protein